MHAHIRDSVFFFQNVVNFLIRRFCRVQHVSCIRPVFELRGTRCAGRRRFIDNFFGFFSHPCYFIILEREGSYLIRLRFSVEFVLLCNIYEKYKISVIFKIIFFYFGNHFFFRIIFPNNEAASEKRGKNVLRPGPRFCGAQEKIIFYFANVPVDLPSVRHSVLSYFVGPESPFIRGSAELPYSDVAGSWTRCKTDV